jgi:Na+-driven multidrug efflux pump
MKRTRLIFIITLMSTLGFGVSLASSVVHGTLLVKDLTFLSVISLGLAAIVGWMWIVAKLGNEDAEKPYEEGK